MNYKKKISYIYLFIIIFFIVFTNTYFNYDASLIYGGADGKSYYDISKFSPNLSDNPIQPIHAERFFFSYIIGIISKLLSIEIYILNRLFVFISIILINKYIINFLIKYNKTNSFILVTLLILNFNPYFSRFYLAVPLIVNDLIFILGSLIGINGFDEKNKKKFFLGLIISSLARQSALALCLAILFSKIYNKKNFFLKYSDIFYSFCIFIFIYFLGYLYSSNIPTENVRSEQYFITIFGLFIESKNFKEIFIFFVWPFLSYGPLILYFLFLIKKYLIIKKVNINLNMFILFFSLLVVMQPILQGVYVSGKNIIRLTTLAYPSILILFLINSEKNYVSKFKIIFFVVFAFIWSCHPSFSNFSFLEIFKF